MRTVEEAEAVSLIARFLKDDPQQKFDCTDAEVPAALAVLETEKNYCLETLRLLLATPDDSMKRRKRNADGNL